MLPGQSHPHRVCHYHFSAIFVSHWSSRFGDVSIALGLMAVQYSVVCSTSFGVLHPGLEHVCSLADQKTAVSLMPFAPLAPHLCPCQTSLTSPLKPLLTPFNSPRLPGLPATCIHVDWSSYLRAQPCLSAFYSILFFLLKQIASLPKKSLWLHITLRMRAKPTVVQLAPLTWCSFCSPASSHYTLVPARHTPSPA